MAFHNFLILRTGAIGDVIHTLPFIKALANSLKYKKIVYAMSASLAPLMSYVSEIDEIVELDLHTGLKGLWEQAHALKEIDEFPRFSDLINLQPHWKTHFISGILRPKQVFTYNKKIHPEKHAWQNFALSYFKEDDHNFKEFSLPDNLPLIKLPLNIIIQKTQSVSFLGQTIAFILGVGKYRPHRAWPLKHWLQLLKLIESDQGLKPNIILIGGEDEQKLAAEFMMALPDSSKIKITNLVGKLDLIGTAAVLSKCILAIGADTGPTHLSAALGIYTIGLFGPTSASRHAPFKGIALRSSNQLLACAKDFNEKKCVRKVLNCMENLIPDQVWIATNSFLRLQNK